MRFSGVLVKINTDRKIGITVKLISFSLLIFLFYTLTTNEHNSLIKHKKFTKGLIDLYVTELRGDKGFHFKYNVNGESYNGFYLDEKNLSGDEIKRIQKLSFPAVFDSLHPRDGDMLIFPTDFKEFNIPFPDSLRNR